jgi:hypothetical protein
MPDDRQWSDDLRGALYSAALVAGLFLDGWNHLNLKADRLGPFLTPWHGLLYAGFAGAAHWMLTRNQTRGRWTVRAIPAGYRPAMAGVAFSATGMAGDALWHTAFGVEQGVARLISPFHVLLLVGSFLVVTCPLRSRWASADNAVEPSLRRFAPALVSLGCAAALVAFFFQYVSPLVQWSVPVFADETAAVNAVLGVLVTNLVFVAPVVFVLRRWQPPFGSYALLCTFIALATAAMTNFSRGATVPAIALGGLAVDAAVQRGRPSPHRHRAHRIAAVAFPAVAWPMHFLLSRVAYGVAWDAALWLGAVVLACLSAYALSAVAVPGTVPAAAWTVPGADMEIVSALPKPRAAPSRKKSPATRRRVSGSSAPGTKRRAS